MPESTNYTPPGGGEPFYPNKPDPDQAIRDAYLGVEIEIEGTIYRARPLTLTDSIRYLQLLSDAEEKGGKAIIEILEEFPKTIGAKDNPGFAKAIDGLMPAEFFDMMRRFFTLRRTPPLDPQSTKQKLATAARELKDEIEASQASD